MATTADPWNAFHFGLEIDGEVIGYFLECSGLKSSAEVFEIEEGGLNGRSYRRPGRSKWENIILRTATNFTMPLVSWRDEFLQDQFKGRRDGSIIQYDLAGNEIRRYTFKKGWPVSWEGPTLKAGGSELAIETLEIAHEGLNVNDTRPRDPDPPPKDPPPEKLELPPIQFKYDSAELTDEGRAAVDVAHEAIEKMDLKEVWIEGHTSTSGSFSYNQNLAAQRAETVKNSLMAKNPNRTYYTQSYGWKYPVASNASASGMAQNRRTDFYTTSYESRGRDPSPITPENRKYDAPWSHRDNAASAEKSDT